MKWVREREYLEDLMSDKTYIRGRKHAKDGGGGGNKEKRK